MSQSHYNNVPFQVLGNDEKIHSYSNRNKQGLDSDFVRVSRMSGG